MKKIKRGPSAVPEQETRKYGREEREDLPRGALRLFRVGEGLPNLTVIQEELQGYTDVLLGRVAPPVRLRDRTLALMEVSDTYFARASEIKMQIQALERKGQVVRGSAHYKFMRGELQTFMDLSRKAADLGSRRLTEENMTQEAENRGREYR